jgi:arylsulfatase A-like enzyme
VHDDLLYQLDLGPTLCDLLGLEAPEDWDGRSFAPLLIGRPYEARPYLVLGQGVWFVQRAVVADGHIYIRTLHDALNPMADELLFDLVADPHEQLNLVGAQPARAAAMSRQMADWWHEIAPQVGSDSLLQVCREGGSLYVRGARNVYVNRLRETGRAWAAEEIEKRRIFPIVDRFDLTRF